jgi:chromosome segregation ATPase
MDEDLSIPTTRFRGRRRAVMDQIISDREAMVHQAEARVRSAEARIAELEQQVRDMASHIVTPEEREAELSAIRELQAVRQDLEARREGLQRHVESLLEEGATREEEVVRLRGEVRDLRAAYEEQSQLIEAAREEAATMLLTEELSTILSTAQSSARQLLERSRVDSERQLADAERRSREIGAEADRRRGELEAEVERFNAWREEVDPMLRSVRARVADVRGRVETTATAMRDSLASIAETLPGIDAGLALLASAFESSPTRANESDAEGGGEGAPGASTLDVASSEPSAANAVPTGGAGVSANGQFANSSSEDESTRGF